MSPTSRAPRLIALSADLPGLPWSPKSAMISKRPPGASTWVARVRSSVVPGLACPMADTRWCRRVGFGRLELMEGLDDGAQRLPQPIVQSAGDMAFDSTGERLAGTREDVPARFEQDDSNSIAEPFP